MSLLTLAVLTSMSLQTYPPAFPRDGVEKVLENERVIVWEGHWTRGLATPMHEHTLDLVGVVLEGAIIKVTLPDGTSRVGRRSQRGHVVFQKKGVIHIEESLSTGHVIGIELKDYTPEPLSRIPSEVPSAFPRTAATLVIDNERVAIWDYRWTPGTAVALHFHGKDAVVVALEAGELRSVDQDGQTTLIQRAFGDVSFAPRNRVHRQEVVRGSPRAIVIELK